MCAIRSILWIGPGESLARAELVDVPLGGGIPGPFAPNIPLPDDVHTWALRENAARRRARQPATGPDCPQPWPVCHSSRYRTWQWISS